MTFREALVEAVEFLRERCDPEEQRTRIAMRLLERKAERLRLREEAARSAEPPALCFCGEIRPPGHAQCDDCWHVTPMAVLFDFHLGRGRVHRHAVRQMKLIAEMRLREEEAA